VTEKFHLIHMDHIRKEQRILFKTLLT